MDKEKTQKRFVRIFKESSFWSAAENALIVDSETGVTYLVVCNSYGMGVTPLIGADGKPVITDLNKAETSCDKA